MKTNERKFPFDLQFFAEEDGETTTTEDTTQQKSDQAEESTEEKFARLQIEYAKVKKAQEKAASEAADYKKKYNSTLSEQQIKAEQKIQEDAEKEERLASAEKKLHIIEVQNTFMDLGYSKEKALEMANAQIENDFSTTAKLQKEFTDEQIKKAQSAWLKDRPKAQSGMGEDGKPIDPFLAGFNSNRR